MYLLHLRLLLWKNFTLKKRKPFAVVVEIVVPLLLFILLAWARSKRDSVYINNGEAWLLWEVIWGVCVYFYYPSSNYYFSVTLCATNIYIYILVDEFPLPTTITLLPFFTTEYFNNLALPSVGPIALLQSILCSGSSPELSPTSITLNQVKEILQNQNITFSRYIRKLKAYMYVCMYYIYIYIYVCVRQRR